ncbi:MAG TPA: NADH-quinone oxidoreductase subunit A, partial [Thermoanaerobaculia bacterium]
ILHSAFCIPSSKVDSLIHPSTITVGLDFRMAANYSVLLVAALIVLSLPVLTLFILAPLVRASRPNKVKLEPYECGVPASSFAFDHRFSVRYFLIAVLFIVFDVETVFLFPWAIRFKQLGWFGAVEMAVFLAILLIGYVYAWKRKVLTWV